MDAPEKNWVWLARVRRPQGRKGEVFADILTDFPEKFAERRRLWLLPADEQRPSAPKPPTSHSGKAASAALAPTEVELIHHWPHKGGMVLHFAELQSISDAEQWSGWIVALPQEQRAPLGEDEAYIGDLIGCTVADTSGPGEARVIGPIESVDREAGPVPLLVVRDHDREVLIPFAKAYLRCIDLQTRRVEMDLPDGLLDL